MKVSHRLTGVVKVLCKVILLLGGVAVALSGAPPVASAQTVVSPNGYAVTDEAVAAYPDRFIRFFPSVPASTRLKVITAAVLYNAAGARITFAPDVTSRSLRSSDITIEVVPGPFYCGNVLARGCIYSRVGSVSGWRTVHSAHIQFGSHIVGKPEELKTILHEMGHAFGLAHYEQLFGGQRQVMSTPVFARDTLGRGDANGVRALTRRFDNPTGSLDAATKSGTGVRISGWAFDANQPTQGLGVHIYVNSKYSTAITANATRSDVNAVLQIATAKTGYSTVVTRGLQQGPNVVCAYAINAGPGTTNPALGCRVVTV